MKGQITVGKWHFKFGVIPTYWHQNVMLFHFGIFKLIKYPLEGYMIDKSCYKGFWLRKQFRINGFEISVILPSSLFNE